MATCGPAPDPPSRSKAGSTTPPRFCIFCNIPPANQPGNSFRIVLEDDEFVAFHDRSPKAKVHLLTVTRQHIKSVRELEGREGAQLGEYSSRRGRLEAIRTDGLLPPFAVAKMHAFGERALDQAAATMLQPSNTDHSQAVTTTSRDPILPSGATRDESILSPPRKLSSDSDKRRLGFHIPPFNSVNHLHLHCLQYPLTWKAKIEYRISPPDPKSRPALLKGWGWFVEVDQAQRILNARRRVRVGAIAAKSTGYEGAREFGGVKRRSGNDGKLTGTLDN